MPKRKEMDKKYTWKLTDLYKTDELWKEDYNFIQENLSKLESFKGTLNKNCQSFSTCLKTVDEFSLILSKLYVYANMSLHQDMTNTFYKGLSEKAEYLSTLFSTSTSYVYTEILSIPKETVDTFLQEDPSLKIYSHFLENLFREKKYILSEREEEILAMMSEVSNSASSIYDTILDGDMTFPNVIDETGKEIALTHGIFSKLMHSENREIRKDVFEKYYSSYIAQKNTFASTYTASIKSDVFYAKVRGYNNCLEQGLSGNKIPVSVYHNLIKTVSDNVNYMHEYIHLRKTALNIADLHFYDLYTPIVTDVTAEIPYEKAVETVLKSLAPLGEEYINTLKESFSSGWIDVYENDNKRSGAYSWGTYGTHPYVLLNYNNTLNDMFTIAHEMGHAMHSYYSNSCQEFVNSNYCIFLAEIASTVNETLLIQYLLKTTTDKKMKLYLQNFLLDQFKGTVFRQTMFAEFELITHEKMENGIPLTVNELNEIYSGLNKKYYGEEIILDEEISYEWARIPHFYNSFYVYQYSTGFCAAIAFADKILNGTEDDLNKYLNFLKSGSSDYPLNILKNSGLDMESTKPIEDALKLFKQTLENFEG